MYLSYLCSLTHRYHKTIQARYINQESSQEIRTRSVQHGGEMPGPHSSLFMAYMHLTQDHRVDSTLALPWERRSALKHQFLGCKLWRSTDIVTPSTQIPYLVSIGWRHVPSYFGEVTMALVYSPCFVARFCHYMSLVFCVEGHHQTCLPLQESLTAKFCCPTKCEPVSEGLMLQFLIFYCSGALAMIHLSCRTIPFLSVSQPGYIWATDLLSLTLTGSHQQMCPCLRYMLSMVLSVGCECMVSLVHKAWFDDEFFLQPLRIYKTVVKEKSFILAMATVLCLPPSLEQCFC